MGTWVGRLGLWEHCALAGLSSATSSIPEDGHFTAWLQAEQGAGGEKLSGWLCSVPGIAMPVVLPETWLSAETQQLSCKLEPSSAGELQARAELLCSSPCAGMQSSSSQW